MEFFLISLFYVLICDYIGRIGSIGRLGYGWSFFISLALTPIIGSVAAIAGNLSGPCRKNDSKRFEEGILSITITRVVGIIIAMNTVLFALEVWLILIDQIYLIDSITLYIGSKFEIWQLVTHQFLHSGIAHLWGNMSVLIVFGSSIEKRYGPAKTLFGYLIFGMVGAAFQICAANLGDNMVGASGAIFGMLALFALADNRLYLRFRWLKMRYLAIVMIISELSTLTNVDDGIGHWAHLGGMLAGLVFYLTQRKDGTED